MMPMDDLIANIDRVHTTDMGAVRVQRNLGLGPDADVVAYCRQSILSDAVVIVRRGKNWYVFVPGVVITINATSFTIITAHNY